MHVHALFTVCAMREVLAVFLGVEVWASLISLSAVRIVLALNLLLIGSLSFSGPSTLLSGWVRGVLLCMLEPDVVPMGAEIDHGTSLLRNLDLI